MATYHLPYPAPQSGEVANSYIPPAVSESLKWGDKWLHNPCCIVIPKVGTWRMATWPLRIGIGISKIWG